MGVKAHSAICQNRVAAGFIQRFQNTFCVQRGLGQSLNKQKTTLSVMGRFGWIFAFGAPDAMLANSIPTIRLLFFVYLSPATGCNTGPENCRAFPRRVSGLL